MTLFEFIRLVWKAYRITKQAFRAAKFIIKLFYKLKNRKNW